MSATLEMQQEFPELIRVRGHYIDCLLGDRPHWWLKTKDGEIVDPTASQFNPGDYEEFDESNPITGKCLNCGDYCYNHKCFCSSECNLELARQYNEPN